MRREEVFEEIGVKEGLSFKEQMKFMNKHYFGESSESESGSSDGLNMKAIKEDSENSNTMETDRSKSKMIKAGTGTGGGAPKQ